MPEASISWNASLYDRTLPPYLGSGNDPWPTDKMLTGVEVIPKLSRKLGIGGAEEIVLKAELAGYVRGKLAPAAGETLTSYAINGPVDKRLIAQFRLNRRSGEFIAGPFLPGQRTLEVQWVGRENSERRPYMQFEVGRFVVEIQPGKVTHIELRASAIDPGNSFQQSLFTTFFFHSDREFDRFELKPEQIAPPPEEIVGRVLLSDGKTPACGAKTFQFTRGYNKYFGSFATATAGSTDDVGRFRIALLAAYNANTDSTMRVGTPNRPALVAWLPGVAGAIVQELHSIPRQPVDLILPPEIVATGSVSVASRNPANLQGRLEVVATHSGLGELDQYFTVIAQPDAAGGFKLPGMTPGKYRIQACLDRIWLSNTVDVNVTVGKTVPQIKLDIAPPGEFVALKVTDRGGKPLIGQRIIVRRPAGPMCDRTWPDYFTTDGLGKCPLEGLEQGRHELQLAATGQTVSITIGPLSQVPPHEIPIQFESTATHGN